jgi:hypothetical protein
MSFCIVCGKEIASDQKFCEFCGASQDGPSAQPAPDVQPPLPPPPVFSKPPPSAPASQKKLPEKKNTMIILGAILVMGFIVFLYFLVALPMNPTSSPAPGAEPSLSPMPQVTTAQPTMVYTTTVTQTAVVRRADQFGETYEAVLLKDRQFDFGDKESFSYNLTRPPLYIRFNITPGMENRSMVVDIGLSTERTVYRLSPNPSAWFEVKVLDSATGSVIDKKGFNKEYNQITKQDLMVRNKGSYRVEMAGNDVFVNVEILVGD